MKTKTVTSVDFPSNYVNLEDKVALMQRVQILQMTDKENNLSPYSSPEYSDLLKELVKSCIAEVRETEKLLHDSEE
ncbi:MAG: hypothetical protein ACD_86C00003G0020 [uncultured bacterium]|nr:MAG: hypothetical protein ACD_86C00003G0020 [uncultured bacterium]